MNHIYKVTVQRGFIIAIVLITCIIVQPSCKKLVQVPAPTNQLVTPSVFASNATANQAQLTIYGSMVKLSESYKMSVNGGLLADEFQNFSSGGTQLNFYKNAMSSSMSVNDGCWGNGYNYIYQANAIIEGLQSNEKVDPLVANRLRAESKFVRAFWYLYLTLCYGDVPLALTTDYTVNTRLARTSRADVFKQILADLRDAEAALPDYFMDVTDTASSSERIRPSSWAAHALLARTYLYTKNYDSAEIEASTVIANTAAFSLNTDVNHVFLANSTEAIWQTPFPLPDATNTPDGNNFILLSSPVGNQVSFSDFLLNSFESGDQRSTNWIKGTITSPVYYYPYKYKVQTGVDPTVHTEYVMVLRLAEQYLIRAEARAQQGDLQGAIDDVNYLRLQHGGLTTLLPLPADKDVALATILHERQVELFSEWGHRWFDLARMGAINTVMDGVTPAKGGTWDPTGYQQLFPIPQAERSNNPHLTQNPGYF